MPGVSAQLSVRAAAGDRRAVRGVERALALGAREVHPVLDEHGWLLGRIEEPFGHHWEIGRRH